MNTPLRSAFSKKYRILIALVSLAVLVAMLGFNSYQPQSKEPDINRPSVKDTGNWPKTFGIGRPATPSEIEVLDISIKPDGRGLPAGSGNAATGKQIYEVKCISCHGKTGTEGPFGALVSTPGDSSKAKTIGNYWPYATTLFDYIRRAMPFNQPGSLTSNDVYSLTAYLLYKNKITNEATVLNAASLPKITMPARHLFINDDRRGGPEVK